MEQNPFQQFRTQSLQVKSKKFMSIKTIQLFQILIYHKMGGQCSGELKDAELRIRKLTVVTLSYCGLTSSPFEFYINEYQHQLERIGDYFQQLIAKELPDFTDKKKGKGMFGPIQLKFKKRYSPMFKKMAGIEKLQGGETQYKKYRFLTQQEFNEKWDDVCKVDKDFQKVVASMKPEEKNKLPQYTKNVKKYDFLMFRALLRYVYKETNFEKVIQENPNKYINIISPLFEFSFLEQTNKLSKFQYGFRKTNPDVYFLQQTTKELMEFLQKRAKRNYRWIGDDDGQLIVIKNQKFPGEEFEVVDVDQKFKVAPPQVDPKERIFKPIALGTRSNHFLFVSLHFSSRQNLNEQQIKYLRNLLQAIKKTQVYDCVILGGNLNSFVDKFPQGFAFYPILETQITTFKKRTKTQAQILKNDIRDKRSIDKIITNRTLLEGEITLIDGTKPDEYSDDEFKKEKIDKKLMEDPQKLEEEKKRREEESKKCGKGLESKIKMLLPCQIHPFDKFLVKTTIQVPNYHYLAQLGSQS